MRKLNNKGLSLVELVIAIAMSTIVVGAAATFLYNAEKSYRVAEYTVDLQTEAQVLMEQMGNWVLKSNYVNVVDASTDQSILVLYQIPDNKKKFKLEKDPDNVIRMKNATGDNKATRDIIFVYDKSLYLIHQTEAVVGEYLTAIESGGFTRDNLDAILLAAHPTDPKPNEEDCIGEYVKGFTVDFPFGVDEDNINSIIVTLGMSEGVNKQSQSYSVKNQFSIRNSVYEIATPAPAEGE